MKLCPKCGTQFPDDANFCPVDASRLVVDERSGAPGAPETQVVSGTRVLGGRFTVGERLGGGQTGQVHRGTDQKNGRPCAIKLVDMAIFPSGLAMQRTERELGKLARIDAEGIAKILGHGKEGDTLWIASELVPECQSLHDLVFDEGPMPVQQAAALVLKVGRALSEAARMGVIHRDLAPKNVLVRGNGAVKVINFGVAVPVTRRVPGVPEFVAPEIIEGKPPDQRANIYSLGVLFYYLITGRTPYMGEPEEVYAQHLKGEPELPSMHAEGISEAVDGLILRALERTSSKRFMTLRQLLGDVERVAEGHEPLSAASSLVRMGRAKNPKLAQTMLGGFRVAADAAARSGQAQAEGSGAAGSTLTMGSPVVGSATDTAASDASGSGAPAIDGANSGEELRDSVESGDGGALERRAAAGFGDSAGEASGGPSDESLEGAAVASGVSPDVVLGAGSGAGSGGESFDGPDGSILEPGEGEVASAGSEVAAGAGSDMVVGPGAASAVDAAATESTAAPAETERAAVGTGGAATGKASRPGARTLDQGQKTRGGPEVDAADMMRSIRAESGASRSPSPGAKSSDGKAVDAKSDQELINEMRSGRGKVVAAVVIGVLLIGAIIAIALQGG